MNTQLGNSAGNKYYARTFIAKGHLSPDADFIFAHEQLLTYFYVNMAPQWQSINTGNWLKVERNVRKLAIKVRLLYIYIVMLWTSINAVSYTHLDVYKRQLEKGDPLQ